MRTETGFLNHRPAQAYYEYTVLSNKTGPVMEGKDFASKSPDRQWGALVFKGTRVPVERIMSYLKHNHTVDAALAEFPSVERGQVEAFLDYALQRLEADVEEHEAVNANPA